MKNIAPTWQKLLNKVIPDKKAQEKFQRLVSQVLQELHKPPLCKPPANTGKLGA